MNSGLMHNSEVIVNLSSVKIETLITVNTITRNEKIEQYAKSTMLLSAPPPNISSTTDIKNLLNQIDHFNLEKHVLPNSKINVSNTSNP